MAEGDGGNSSQEGATKSAVVPLDESQQLKQKSFIIYLPDTSSSYYYTSDEITPPETREVAPETKS